MNSSLKKLVKNLSMIWNIWLKNLVLFCKKSAYPYEYRDSFQKFGEEKLPDGECFYSPVKDRATGDNGEKLDCHISNEDYLMCTKIWMNLTWKIWVMIITIIIWKKMFCS